MARDNVFPFSNYLRWVFKRTRIPLANVIFVFIIDALFLLLQLVSTTVFTALVATAALGYQISYLMPILFRCTTARHKFPLGDFSLGRLSMPIAIISCIWLFITTIIMFFPFEYPIKKDNMNYAIVIIGGAAVIPLIYWIVSARHRFVGPNIPEINPIPLSSGHVTANDVSITPLSETSNTAVSQM